jgi:hypothetical protein
VKANRRSAAFWLVGGNSKTLGVPSHVYVFVNFNDTTAEHEFYVVPSTVVKRRMLSQTRTTGSIWHSFHRRDALQYRNRWNVFGCP